MKESEEMEESYVDFRSGDASSFGIHVYVVEEGNVHLDSPSFDIDALLKTEPVYVFGLEEGNSPGR